jgi:large subunit ribosomal protein L13
VIIGRKTVIIKKYRTRLNFQEKQNPEHSPYWSRRPDMILRRAIRGMLPDKPSGKAAFRRLMVFATVPPLLEKAKPIEIKEKNINDIYMSHVTIKELARSLSYTR